MSAYIVDKIHIDALVHIAYEGPKNNGKRAGYGQQTWYRPYFRHEQVDFVNLDDLGDLLIKENLSSIHARYPDTLENPANTPDPCEQYWLEPYIWTRPARRLTVIEALKAIACYEYQACEHPEWKDSEAKQFCETLRHALIGCLPGYDEADWEVKEIA